MVNYASQKMKQDKPQGMGSPPQTHLEDPLHEVLLGTSCSGTDVVVLIWEAFFKAMREEWGPR